MSLDAETLFRLLPAIHRTRDAQAAAALGPLLTAAQTAELVALEAVANPTPEQQGRIAALHRLAARGPLEALLTAFAAEYAVVEENLNQLYDDLFIETCADWVVPYIGDLIGYEPLHAKGQTRALARAEVAHTIALRRRKGTATALEQIAADVTGWGARVVEYFELVAATQYLNHPRPHCRYAPDLRRGAPLANLGGAFESVAHTLDVRRIQSGRGRFNIPNVGIFLWRLTAFRHTASPALRVDDRRWLLSPLGHPLQLFTAPQAEDEITHLAEPINVPAPIGRRTLGADLALYYGTRRSPADPVDNADPSILVLVDGQEVPRGQILACNLADLGAAWAHVPPAGKIAIDPVLGRIALAPDLAVPKSLRVTYHYGFPAAIGGGEYQRERAADPAGTRVVRVPGDRPTIKQALKDLRLFAQGAGPQATPFGVVEVGDSGRYSETLTVNIQPHWGITLRAAPGCRPVLVLSGELAVTGGEDSTFTLDGLLVAGGPVRIANTAGNSLVGLRLNHSTLVPGRALTATGEPLAAGALSLQVELPGVAVGLAASIVGAIGLCAESGLSARDSIIDATAPERMAFSAPDGVAPGGELSLDACTVIGKVNALAVGLVANSLLLAREAPGDTLPPVHTVRRQSGCVRFTYLPLAAMVPRRHRCQPAPEDGSAAAAPRFTSLRYGTAAYCQLARVTPEAIRAGADDEGELGAFHSLYPAQREANLEVRLQEFLRAGLSAGIFYET
jgi:hypothetical protein